MSSTPLALPNALLVLLQYPSLAAAAANGDSSQLARKDSHPAEADLDETGPKRQASPSATAAEESTQTCPTCGEFDWEEITSSAGKACP